MNERRAVPALLAAALLAVPSFAQEKTAAPPVADPVDKPAPRRVPGFDVTELYPKQAKITNLFSMVRSLHHDTGDHFAGGNFLDGLLLQVFA